MLVPVSMYFMSWNGENPYLDASTSMVVFLMSLFLMLVVRINQLVSIPLLRILIVVYVVFWHLRFLTLALFPESELVLERTVHIDHDIFYSYAWVVFASLVASVLGIIAAHFACRSSAKQRLDEPTGGDVGLNESVSGNVFGIFVYCVSALVFQIIATQIPAEALPLGMGYLSLFFPFSLIMLLVGLVLLNERISILQKSLVGAYLLGYVSFSVLTGSRSILMHFVLGVIFLLAILGKKLHIRLTHLVVILAIGLAVLFSFAYGTYQRHMRGESGMVANAEVAQYVMERVTSLEGIEDWKPMIGVAAARAGYLDYSAEMVANESYNEVINIENVFKGFIDGLLPGSIFEDSRLMAIRIRDVYNPNAEGYQSDAIGMVGENFLLFGYGFPVAIAVVAFVFGCLYYFSGGGIFGVFIKFSVAIWLMTWWNSFGYDWLLLDMVRQALFGAIVIALIFRNRSKDSIQLGLDIRR